MKVVHRPFHIVIAGLQEGEDKFVGSFCYPRPQKFLFFNFRSISSDAAVVCCYSHCFRHTKKQSSRISYLIMGSFGELVLVLGDLYIPERANVISEQFKR